MAPPELIVVRQKVLAAFMNSIEMSHPIKKRPTMPPSAPAAWSPIKT
jgi:hypothetical protein